MAKKEKKKENVENFGFPEGGGKNEFQTFLHSVLYSLSLLPRISVPHFVTSKTFHFGFLKKNSFTIQYFHKPHFNIQ